MPKDVFHIIALLSLTWLSGKVNQRALIAIFQPIWVLPCLVALYTWPGLLTEKWNTYILITVLLSYPYCHAINV